MSADAELVEYLKEASSWDADRVGLAERAARRARALAATAVLVAVCALLALALLMPLKTVQPYVIRVDARTGAVDVVPQYQGGASASETVTRYLLTHYVTTCERFNFATAEEDYSECGAFHTPKRNQEWALKWASSNPDSPLNRYKDGSSMRAEVQSVSFFERASGVSDLAQVRYRLIRRNGSGIDENTTHWIATIQYAYVAPSQDPKTRQWNPLGFRIVEFHPEPETDGTATTARFATGETGTSSP
jgi:type IV secretion system protein VirB8